MKIINNGYIARSYRKYRLKKNTPEIIRTLFVERNGKLSELSNKFGEENIKAQLYLNHISEKYDDCWELTKNDKDNIETFYTKPSPFQLIKSTLFGTLSKLF